LDADAETTGVFMSMVEELKAAIASVRDAYAKTDTRGSSEAYDLAYSRAFDLIRDHGQALVEAVADAERWRHARACPAIWHPVVSALPNLTGWKTPRMMDDYIDADLARTKAGAGGGA
jgi:hypothetical protein